MSPSLPAWLQAYFSAAPAFPSLHVALSGGADSVALLHALSQTPRLAPGSATQPTLHAIHINHGLHQHAGDWAAQVADLCRRLQIDLTIETISVKSVGDGLEAAARAGRYQVFLRYLPAGAALLMAHHRDDQAETVLLRLLRGAGLRGLAAIPEQRPLGQGVLLRPLLQWSRQQLRDYCAANELPFIDDPANADLRHQRNRIRHQVMPLLEQHWPGAAEQIARSAACLRQHEQRHQAEEVEWLRAHRHKDGSLLVASWQGHDEQSLDDSLCWRLLATWLKQLGAPPLNAVRGHELLRQIRHAAADRHPALEWSGGSLRLYQQRLYWLPADWAEASLPSAGLDWTGAATLCHPWYGQLFCQQPWPAGLRLQIQPRLGGESLRTASGHRRSVKQILQEQRLPPWLRERVPLIYLNDELQAVADLAISPELRQRLLPAGDQGSDQPLIKWSPPTVAASAWFNDE
ncbi:MAG: tRNA lysidine(34) synthetase TilS [Wenzhouxiangellaceae bacterium]